MAGPRPAAEALMALRPGWAFACCECEYWADGLASESDAQAVERMHHELFHPAPGATSGPWPGRIGGPPPP